jgi:TRAP-type mannitol/chloroaromatic compound transport system permease small subunit
MQRLLALARRIDRLNERIGAVASWLTLLMIAAGAYNAIARHVDRAAGVHLSSNAWIEAQWYMFSLVFLLGAAYTLKRDEHVRVDVLHGRLPAKAKAWIEIAGTALLMLPFCAVALWVAVPSVLASFEVREGSPDPGGLPRYPLKAVILVAFALLFVQGLSVIVKKVAVLRGIEVPKDTDEAPAPEKGAA